MKIASLLCLIAATALMTACATTSAPTERRSAQNVDQAYVAAVERQASHIGTRVYWLNPPKQRRSRTTEN